ncbi:RDD family protein [Mycobacterium sp. 1164985.4]|uniref:RDD family protein n=1 Tax=Mycobacterium sp. 1164985.4 TaxID=1834069 RepID=UPI0007FEFE45|nr:RDD family protein [Mycobacterium sp. 1164985.4]OBK78862.1 hypothetical protein A5650_09775 [Mycobacterium sp. 1164985.4]
MTDQPQPPGDYPPPPPGGYPPPPQGDGTPPTATGYPPPAQPVQALPKEAYTSWFTRVLAWLIDSIPIFILWGIGYALLLGTRETACITDVSEYELGEFCATGASTVGQLAVTITSILVLAYVIWNYGYRQGTTGSSIGKSMLKFKVVGEKIGQPIGFGMSVVRQLAHIIDAAICYVGYLFPLWDAKRQTIADKLIGTVCLPL